MERGLQGWFRTRDGKRCDPLTLTDNYSRFLLRCQAVGAESTAFVKPILEAAFLEYGLPERIRSDNGPPFGSNGDTGLTALNVWWMKLGIIPERIAPGRPQQNGRHERMHETLQQETASPPAATLRQQQRRFDEFRREYNEVRPHEALAQRPPATLFEISPRAMPSRLTEPEYPAGWLIRRIQVGGQLGWGHDTKVFISHALAHEHVGLAPVEDGMWRVWFGRCELGVVDRKAEKFYTHAQWEKQQQRRQARTGAPGAR